MNSDFSLRDTSVKTVSSAICFPYRLEDVLWRYRLFFFETETPVFEADFYSGHFSVNIGVSKPKFEPGVFEYYSDLRIINSCTNDNLQMILSAGTLQQGGHNTTCYIFTNVNNLYLSERLSCTSIYAFSAE